MITLNKYLSILLFLTAIVGVSQTNNKLIRSGEIIKGTAIRSNDWKVHETNSKNSIKHQNKKENKASNTFSAGSTPASFSVSLTGAATYSIPIATPPGIKDIAPNVGLSYNSQSANGLAGWGWNISGLSSISRIGATIFHDDAIDGVDFDSKDRFSLDGRRLIIKSGTYGASNSEYQTENYSNIKIIASGVSPHGATYGPSYFTAYYPDGAMAVYGSTTDSNGKLEWLITKKQDPQGNYIQYLYSAIGNAKKIDKILFGSKNGTAAPIEIKFIYKNRNRPEFAYVNSHGIRRVKVLDRIEVKGNGQLYRKYVLTHDSTQFEYQRLTSVQEFNKDNEALSPITFNYANSSNNENPSSFSGSINPGFNYKTDVLVSGEFNGDGNLDFIKYDKNNKNKIYLFDKVYAGGSDIARSYNVPQFDHIIGNNMLNNEGKLLSQQGITFIKENVSNSASTIQFKSYYSGVNELYGQYTRTWNNAPTYSFETSCDRYTRKKISKTFLSGDFNGDGLTDILAVGKPYRSNNCYTWDGPDCGGNTNDDQHEITQQKGDNNTDFLLRKKGAVNDGNSTLSPEEVTTAKQNSNRGECCSCNSYTTDYKSVYFIDLNRNITSSFVFSAGNLQKSIGSNDQLRVADFNGDGKTDLLHFSQGAFYVYEIDSNNRLSLIYSLINESIALYKDNDIGSRTYFPVLLGDYNGDGKTDFVMPTAHNSYDWKFFFSKGNGLYQFSKTLSFNFYESKRILHSFPGENSAYFTNQEVKYSAMDINGDGKTDIIRHAILAREFDNPKLRSKEVVRVYLNKYGQTVNDYSFEEKQVHYAIDSGVSSFGIPIQLKLGQSYRPENEKYEYAYLSANKLIALKFDGNHKKDTTLESIVNNGITHDIEYSNLSTFGNDQTYTADNQEIYPYVNLNVAPNYSLVKQIKQTGAGYIRTQDFRYKGATYNAHGLGFIGFKQIQKSNWHGDDVQRLWNISTFNPQKRNAIIQSWSSIIPSSTPANPIDKTDYTYNSILTDDKVYINVPTRMTTKNELTGVLRTTNYSYDSYYNPTSITTSFPGGSERVTHEYYNNPIANDQLYAIGRPRRKFIENRLAGDVFTSEERYYYTNNLLKEVRQKGHNTNWLNEYFLYDAFGNVTQKTLRGTGITDRIEHFEYDTSGRFVLKSMDIEGLETSHTYEAATGNPLTTTNPYGHTTNYLYDGWQRLVRRTNYLGKHTDYSFENSSLFGEGGVLKTTNYDQGQDEKTYYNAYGLIERASVLSLNNKWVNMDFEYDIEGKKIKESEPYFSNSSPTQWNQYNFDEYGRPVSQNLYTGRVTSTAYNGLTTTVNDGIKTVITTVDALGNVISHKDPGGTVTYSYYANNSLKSTHYDGQTTTVEIDGWGRKIALNDPSAGNYTYEHSIIGEPLKATTPKGETSYEYDDYGKIISKKVIGHDTNLDIQYSYDTTSKLLKTIEGNDLINSKNYRYSYSYDSYYRLFRTTETTETAIYRKINTYDEYGRVNNEIYRTRSYISGIRKNLAIKNTFDAAGILNEVRDYTTKDLLWKIDAENARGQATRAILGNGMTKTNRYDNYGNLKSILDRVQFSDDHEITALKMDYNFNAERGILNSRKNHAFANWEEEFSYDNLNRLTQINGAVVHRQSYDNKGRITNNSYVGDYKYLSDKKYQLETIDLNNQGDIYYQQNKLQQVTYNAFKKPVDIYQEDNGRVSFEYGPLMNRTHAYYGGLQEDKAERQYHKQYSSIMPVEIIEDKDGNAKIVTYLIGDGYTAPVAHIIEEGNAPKDDFYYLHRDYLGSILAITDSNAALIEQRQFGAWGKTHHFVNDQGSTTFDRSSLIGRGYTGHEHFFEVALIHMNGRMYDAQLGRFLSPDNFVQDPYNTQNFNRYGYVWNNPLSFNDPGGEWIHIAIGAVIGGLVNLGVKAYQGKINSWGDGFAAFGIGAVAGAVGAATGGAAFLAAGGGAAGAGGFIAGAAGGALGTAFASPIQSLGNTAYFGDPLMTGQQFLVGVAFGAITGGLINGGIAAGNGRSFLNGNIPRPTLSPVSGLQPQGITSVGDDLAISSDGVPDLVPAYKPSPSSAPGPTIHKGTDGLNSGNLNLRALDKRGVGNFLKFDGDEAIVHFGKHGKSVMNNLGRPSYSIKNYLSDANHVIKNGTFVKELNGYVRLIGGQGSAKFGFVGMNRATGNITTFHIKTAKELAKKAPGIFGY